MRPGLILKHIMLDLHNAQGPCSIISAFVCVEFKCKVSNEFGIKWRLMEPEAGYSACLVTHQVFGYDICVRCSVMLLLCCLRNVRLHICPTYWGFFCFYFKFEVIHHEVINRPELFKWLRGLSKQSALISIRSHTKGVLLSFILGLNLIERI